MVAREIRNGEGIVWAGIGAGICFLAWGERLGSFEEPGPGFIAFAAGLLILVVGLVMLFSAALSKIPQKGGGGFRDSVRSVSPARLIYTMGLLCGYAIFLEPLGYILATLLLMWGLFYDWERNNWGWGFLSSLLATAAFYLLFEVGLGLRFPHGLFP